MKVVVLLGRILFSSIFIFAGISHFFPQTIAYASNYGCPMAPFLVPLSGLISVLGGLSILLGYKARIGAWLIVIFLVPVTLMMHNYWAMPDPMAAMMQRAMFMKNLALVGATLIIAYFGSGPLSMTKK